MDSPHFARIEPIVGPTLRQARVAVYGLPAAAPLVEYLAACGVGHWLWAAPSDDCAETLARRLLAHHGQALGLDAITLPEDAWIAAVGHTPPDLVISVGMPPLKFLAAERRPTLLVVLPPTGTRPCHGITVFPSDDPAGLDGRLSATGVQSDIQPVNIQHWSWLCAAPLCAGLARAILLRDTAHARPDLAMLWSADARVCSLGWASAPFEVQYQPLSTMSAVSAGGALPHFDTPAARRGVLLVVGLGSLGSIAASYLVDYTERMALADAEHVDVYNPARQAYPIAAIGQPKAQALAALLSAKGTQSIAYQDALISEHDVDQLVEQYGITGALVTTGTDADFAIARALRARDLPHVVGRCYPRARYWEAIIVDGRRGPALADLRGHLRPGPMPPPTPEQLAAYSMAGALEAEPATLIESGWAAIWLARLVAQMLAPAGLRERWLLELLAAQRTCLLGGVSVEQTPDGPAYGIGLPGGIRAIGRTEIRTNDSGSGICRSQRA